MSKGWRLEKYIFHFYDNHEELELGLLSRRLLFSDSTRKDYKTITTDIWMVFDSDSSVRSLSSYDNYYRPKGETEWILDLKANGSESIAEWGFNKNDSLYIFEPHITQIEILNEDCFIIQNSITIESSQLLPDNQGTLTIIHGDYPAGTLQRIDVVYTSATVDEGPSFFPPWPVNGNYNANLR